MRRRRLCAALLLASAGLTGCARSDPEEELRAAIGQMTEAIGQQRVADALAHVAEDFTRESGAFGKADARRVLAAAMLRNERIHLTTTVTGLRIDGERAFARLRVIAAGGAGLFPERGQTWEFETAWRRDGGDWKVYNAEWREGL